MKISERSRISTARSIRPLTALWCAAALATAVGATSVRAAEDDLYTVDDVAVDVTSDNATKAREIAMAEGYAAALRRLVDRLVPRDRRAEVPVLQGEALAGLVRDFEVDSEKTSPVRYLAKLRIRFNKDRFREILRDAGVPYAQTWSKPLLVLPVLRRAGAALLWDEPNPWREAWAGLRLSDGLLPLVAPRGGLRDMSFISAEQALRGDRERLDAIARRYDTFGAVVATATLKRDLATGEPLTEVSLRRTTDPKRRVWRNTIESRPGESEGELLARSARETLAFVQEQWKLDNLLRFDQKNELVVVVPLEEVADWVRVRERLARIGYVSQSELVALSRRMARVRLHYFGGEDQLRAALIQADLSLSEEQDEEPVLRYVPRDDERRRTRAAIR